MAIQKQKVWLLVDSSKSGGIESHIHQLAKGLQDHDQQPQVVFLRDYGFHPLKEQLRKDDIDTQTLSTGFMPLLKAITTQRPDIIHTHGYKAGIMGRLAATILRVAVVSTYHAGEVPKGKLALYDKLDRLTAFLGKHIFAVSPQIAKRISVQTEIFDNFVNNSEIKESEGTQIAFVGRVSHEKGPDRFIKLARKLTEQQLYLYGDGPQLAELKQDLPTNLHALGQQDDMASVWPKIGLLVIPSRYEGLPMAALEAMARGIPVIAFRVGALDKLINHQINGWLLAPGDVNGMAQIIGQWCELSETSKQQIRNTAKQTIATHFSSTVAIPKLITRYQQASSK
ncbi:glycosyltransferase family 4 protein [Psychromonas sp. KJ10-10]|uniref:glycosyltransferase family 4 protein n=1 Tax=Psychromonas sp. KJ10-10 TaxID=3391823 RepID=UPI0039B560C8